MSRSAKFPCRQPGCAKLLDSPGYCDAHRKEVYKAQRQVVTIDYKERKRFYDRKVWRDARAAQLQREPMCRLCRKYNKLTLATVVDHIIDIEHGGDMLDQSNLQSVCVPCHARKTRIDEHKRSR